MKIRSVTVDGFRGLPDREFAFLDERTGEPARIVAITGPAASGKTSLLDAIVAAKESVAPYGAMPSESDLLRYDADAAKVTVGWQLAAPERERIGVTAKVLTTEAIFGDRTSPPNPDAPIAELLGAYDASDEIGKVEYFHAERGMSVGSPIDLSKAAGDTMDRMARLARDNRKYSGLVRFIVEAGLGLLGGDPGRPHMPGRIKNVFETLCGTKKLGGLYRVDGQVLPGFFDTTERVPFGITQLSSSELDLLLFATTFVRAGLVQNRSGCVILIDSPEKHVGEADAGALVRGLAALGAENQLVVASRAASVAGAAQCHLTLH
jgi:hypothetical protein